MNKVILRFVDFICILMGNFLQSPLGFLGFSFVFPCVCAPPPPILTFFRPQWVLEKYVGIDVIRVGCYPQPQGRESLWCRENRRGCAYAVLVVLNSGKTPGPSACLHNSGYNLFGRQCLGSIWCVSHIGEKKEKRTKDRAHMGASYPIWSLGRDPLSPFGVLWAE